MKKTVNQDQPTVYHLFYADEQGNPGADLTFFEFPGAPRGRAGAGMVHRIVWRVASTEALDFWAERLGAAGRETEREGDRLRFADPEGLEHELRRRDASPTQPLIADHPEVPAELALQGFDCGPRLRRRSRAQRRAARDARVRAASTAAGRRAATDRGGIWLYDEPPAEPGLQGAGTVHHIAWASNMDEHLRLARARDRGRRAPDAGDRPLLVPLDLLPRAERGAVRDRDARARASTSTRTPSTWARS